MLARQQIVEHQCSGWLAADHDLVAFLHWMGEPAQGTRVRIGVWVLLFLAFFTFLAWLLKGAEYEIVRRIRAIETQKRSAHCGLVPIDEQVEEQIPGRQPTASQGHDEHELSERIREALQQLPDREREIIVLKRYLELDTDEICAELGLPTEGAVRALLSRAQARLSGLLSRKEA